MNDRGVLATGIYSFSEAARLIEVSPQRVRAWFRGWPGGQGPVFRSCLARGGSRPSVMGFLNLVEALVASQLREHGVTLPTIRKAHQHLAGMLGNRYPFAHQNLLTDGKTVFVHIAEEVGDAMVIDALDRQHVFERVVLPYLRRMKYSGASHLAEVWDIFDDVVIDPRRRFGKPIVERCGIATSILSASYEANGADEEAVADWFGIAPQDVRAAVKFEERYRRTAA
jgi:uncharacterized protein (DUF433 family)